jgi:hypothetical protein
MNLSSALEYSSQPPVSVYGTGRYTRFSWRKLSRIISAAVALLYYLRLSADSTHNSVCAHRRHSPVTFVV